MHAQSAISSQTQNPYCAVEKKNKKVAKKPAGNTVNVKTNR